MTFNKKENLINRPESPSPGSDAFGRSGTISDLGVVTWLLYSINPNHDNKALKISIFFHVWLFKNLKNWLSTM
jgi:hypothetical protein